MNIEEKFNFKKFLKGFVSKKLIVWFVATVALFMGLIPGIWWCVITAGYLGVNVTQDYITELIRKKNE
ncbi:MAG: hypothetical protein ACXABY_14230 [Candidatus Thorarchaeota archaeon]|jgi:hypothetical protein